MAFFIPYSQICDDLQAAFKAEPTLAAVKTVAVDAMDRDFIFENMPLLDIRVKRAEPEPVTNATYYSDLTLEVEVCVYDMTNRGEAARIRNDLTNAIQLFVKANPRFSSSLETTIVGQVDFLTGESKAEGAFVAGATLELHPKIYTE